MKRTAWLAVSIVALAMMLGGGRAGSGAAQAAPATDPCTRPTADDDHDGLLNGWECGPFRFPEGRLNLAALGANPRHKDVFVECDYMQSTTKNLQPLQSALDRVATMFRRAPASNPDHVSGITIHIDAGSVGVNLPNVPGAHRGHAIAYVEDWDNSPFTSGEFDAVKAVQFAPKRQHAFHYCIFANNYADNYSSGLSRGIPASDFLVTLGGAGWGPYPRPELEQQQAGTFAHELGHNLGLHHGGDGEDNYKPNYLSIMNYAYQLNGLLKGGSPGKLDYSRFATASLDETNLVELDGIGGPPRLSNFGALWSCPDGSFGLASSGVDYNVRDGVDWNCDGTVAGVDSQSINNPSFFSDGGVKSTLTSYDDWAHIVYRGGTIGAGARPQVAVDSTQLEELGPR